MQLERTFTISDLRRYDGENAPMYVAYQGVVYDVSDSPRWKSGLHEQMHFPGQDLSGEIIDAPHGAEVFTHQGVQRVGKLIS
jgi:predicted heme/steroid binding protein